MTGDIGLLFFCSNSDQDTAALLTAALIRQYASGGPNLDNLVPETLPARREETLTLEQAREAALGIYLPESVPQRYSFQTAQSNSLEGQGETLLARWQAGEHVILIQIEHLPTYTSRPAAADFTPEEVTPQALESFSSSAAASGRSGAGYSFTVTFENVRVYYLVSGLSDIEAAALVVQPSL